MSPDDDQNAAPGTRDKLWPRLFDEETDYQTITIGLARPDHRAPHAGVTRRCCAASPAFSAYAGVTMQGVAVAKLSRGSQVTALSLRPGRSLVELEATVGAAEARQDGCQRRAASPAPERSHIESARIVIGVELGDPGGAGNPALEGA
jgi:hypothetical protein